MSTGHLDPMFIEDKSNEDRTSRSNVYRGQECHLTVCRSVASFSMEGFRLSTAFRPSWKKL